MCGPPHTAPLDSKRGSIPPSSVVGLATLQLPCQRLVSPPGRQAGSREGGEPWDLWERRRLAHPGGHRQRPAAHRRPGCSCRTVAWTWRGWTLHSGSTTCSDKGKSGQPRDRPGPARDGRRCLPRVRPGKLSILPRPPRPSSRPHHRLWPSSSSLVRSPAAATAGPLGPSSSFFSTPTGAILPTAATKRALPRASRGPARTREDPGRAVHCPGAANPHGRGRAAQRAPPGRRCLRTSTGGKAAPVGAAVRQLLGQPCRR